MYSKIENEAASIALELCEAAKLKAGDIVNVDCTTEVNGYFGDSSRMFEIGEVSENSMFELLNTIISCDIKSCLLKLNEYAKVCDHYDLKRLSIQLWLFHRGHQQYVL